MTDDGKFAAVAAIERVKNPIRAARLVLDSPHVLLVGEGATRFAHKLGLPDELPISPQAEANYKTRMARLKQAIEAKDSKEPDWRDYWNFPGDMPPDMVAWRHGGDTVGTVVRTDDGHFAAALSTGGTSVTLHGRVGDVPIYGAGLFAAPPAPSPAPATARRSSARPSPAPSTPPSPTACPSRTPSPSPPASSTRPGTSASSPSTSTAGPPPPPSRWPTVTPPR